jgi:branched-chain amino acid transport system permease protein
MGATTAWTHALAQPRGGSAFLENDRAFYGVSLLALVAAYGLSAPSWRPLRAGAARHPGERDPHGGHRLPAVPVPARGLCDQRHDGGLAGCLLANQAEFVSPAYMTWQRSGELIFMVVLGGLGSLHGAVIGAAAFLLLEEFLPELLHGASFFLSDEIRDRLAENWKMVFGPLLILIVLFARGGIMGLLRRGHHG